MLKGFLLAQGASHGLGDIRVTNHCVSTCTAQHKIFLLTKHSTIRHLTVCSYEQQKGNIISTLNPNTNNHTEWTQNWSCVSKYEEGLDILLTIILSHTQEIETTKRVRWNGLKFFNEQKELHLAVNGVLEETFLAEHFMGFCLGFFAWQQS